MAKIWVLLVVLCAVVAGGSGVFSSDSLGYGSKYGMGDALAAGAKEEQALWDAGAVVRAAQKEIGVRELGENAGARVYQYNAYVGLHKVAWCAAFVSWCHGQAGYPRPRTAWSPALFPVGRLAKKAAAGMILGIYYREKGRIAHCGIVERLQGDFLISIEGNTNVLGSREGDGVYRKIRHKRTIAAYSNWLKKM